MVNFPRLKKVVYDKDYQLLRVGLVHICKISAVPVSTLFNNLDKHKENFDIFIGGVYSQHGPFAGLPICGGKRRNSLEKERIEKILAEMANAHINSMISGTALPKEYSDAVSLYDSIMEAKEEIKRVAERKRKAEEERQGSMAAVEAVMNLRPPAPRLSEEHFSPVSAFSPAPQDIQDTSAHHLPAPRPRAAPPAAGFMTPFNYHRSDCRSRSEFGAAAWSGWYFDRGLTSPNWMSPAVNGDKNQRDKRNFDYVDHLDQNLASM
mmetsp:Transcript_1662/g.3561  ORF Transcript_1662/g.3561 Transcript_1662/m.3561 type:complete len:264 (+) Transcript_1662:60-851(+)